MQLQGMRGGCAASFRATLLLDAFSQTSQTQEHWLNTHVFFCRSLLVGTDAYAATATTTTTTIATTTTTATTATPTTTTIATTTARMRTTTTTLRLRRQ